MRMMLIIQFAHVAVILPPCFCLIYAAERNSNAKQTSPPSCCSGIPGMHGFPGRDGRDGREGPKGDPGSPGKTGSRGSAGVHGKDGAKGEPGVRGSPGPKGERGQGLMPFKNWKEECAWKDLNDDKDSGLIKPSLCCNDGQPGSNGIPGVNGLPGSTGAPGRDGRDGIKGEQGSPGKTGPQGPTGAKGMKGERCITGPVGPKGDRGEKGDNGIQAGPHNMCSHLNWKECTFTRVDDKERSIKLSVHEELYTNGFHVYFAGNPCFASCDKCCSRWYFTFMALSVALLVELMARIIWQQQRRAKTFTVTVTLKDTAMTFTREKCEWDFGLETAIMHGHALADAYTGWTTMSGIFIEEVARAQQYT